MLIGYNERRETILFFEISFFLTEIWFVWPEFMVDVKSNASYQAKVKTDSTWLM